jgi:hypothetical protein
LALQKNREKITKFSSRPISYVSISIFKKYRYVSVFLEILDDRTIMRHLYHYYTSIHYSEHPLDSRVPAQCTHFSREIFIRINPNLTISSSLPSLIICSRRLAAHFKDKCIWTLDFKDMKTM